MSLTEPPTNSFPSLEDVESIVTDQLRMTDRSMRVLNLAVREAHRRKSDSVEPQHVLTGVVLEATGIAADLLRSHGVTAERIEKELPSVAPDSGEPLNDLPWSAGTARVVERAQATVVRWRHFYLGAEHLLMGLLGEEEGMVPTMLARLGMAAESAERELEVRLGFGGLSSRA